MTSHSCCSIPSRRNRHPLIRRCAAVAQWLIPSVVLALMPKCPACVAAYIAIATGVGISMSVASSMRTLLLVACVSALCFVSARWLRRLLLVPHS